MTLTGEPDWLLILWQWDKTKILATFPVGLQSPSPNYFSNFQVSFNPFENCSVVLTGPGIYSYYDIKELSEFDSKHSQVNYKDREVSNNYACHCWMEFDGSLRLIVATVEGDIIVLENSGDYLAYVQDSPGAEQEFTIHCIRAF